MMKKIFNCILLFVFAAQSIAQVGIGTTTPQPNAVLDISSSKHGMLFPRMTTEERDAIANPAKGLTIFNVTLNCLQANTGTSTTINWECFTAPFTLDCGAAIFSPSALYQNVSANGGSFIIPYSNGNGATYATGTPISATGVTGTLAATLQSGTLTASSGNLVFNLSGTPTSSGTAIFAISYAGQECTVSVVVNAGTPATITLMQNYRTFIASVNDSNYLPYTAPTGPATTVTPSNPDGIAETLINIQGIITTTGLTIRIPCDTSGSGTLPAFSATVNVPAELTEDGIARDIRFSWATQTYTNQFSYITANIKTLDGTLNVKKLDINTGVGNDNLGVLLASITYPYNSSGATTTWELRDNPGIPDRAFENANHRMLYMPVIGADGRIWLNNNLGADYANLNKTSFNPSQQATQRLDWKAFGSLLQWGRKTDGHELINRSSSSSGTFVNATTTTISDSPSNSLFILAPNTPNDWRINQSSLLWSGVNAVANPCPVGFRVPTLDEWTLLVNTGHIMNRDDAFDSTLKLLAGGARSHVDGLLYSAGANGWYWAADTNITYAKFGFFNINSSQSNTFFGFRATGYSVRCIKD